GLSRGSDCPGSGSGPKYRTQVLDASRGNRFRPFIKLKHLNRDITRIADVLKGHRDGTEIRLSESWPLEVCIIGMEVSEVRPGLADDALNRLALRRHRFHIEDDTELRTSELFSEADRLGGRIDEIRFRWREWFKTDRHLAFAGPLRGGVESGRCPVP